MVNRSSREVQRMFGSIAHRYDFLNHLLSLSVDRSWRRFLGRKLKPFLDPQLPVLDLCTGTGDVALEVSRNAPVVGCDFCHPMLLRGSRKASETRTRYPVQFVEGDALKLPFEDGRFQAVTVAFGLRNLEDYAGGLHEMKRVLQSKGILAVLEFSEPSLPVFRQLYGLYFRWILPLIGRLFSGRSGPYSYLPASVGQFPDPESLKQLLLDCGYSRAWHYSLTGGIARLHMAQKP